MFNPSHYPPEKEFLLTLALNQYNAQYNRTLEPEDCQIKSIPARPFTDRGYEISTIREDDQLVMQMFITFSSKTSVTDIIVEATDEIDDSGASIGVMVLFLDLDAYFVEQDIYKFRTI